MPSFPILCNDECCDFIEATLCADQTAPDNAQRIFVRHGGLAAGISYFKWLGYCYSIDADGTQTFPPQGSIALQSIASAYDDCEACTNPPDGPGGGGGGGDPGGGGGGGGGPGGGGGGGGGNGGGGGTPADLKGFLLTPCDGGLDDLWVLYYAVIPYGTRYIRVGAYCYYWTQSNEPDDVPDGANYVYAFSTYADCDECKGGIPAVLCPDQDITFAQPVWIRAADLPSATVIFRFDGYCFKIDPDQITEPIPAGAFVVTPPATSEFDDCTECVQGVLAVLCPDQLNPDDAPAVWVPRHDLPAGFRVFMQSGYCFSLDPDDDTVAKPPGAIVRKAANDFDNCSDCLCGVPHVEKGVKAQPCPNQPWGPYAPEIYSLVADLPDETIYFVKDQICYSLNPADPVQNIPVGGLILLLRNRFLGCEDCKTSLYNPPPPDDQTPKGIQAEICPGQNPTNPPDVWVNAADATESGVFSAGGYCYKLDDSLTAVAIPTYATVVVPDITGDDCDDCIVGVTATACDDQEGTPPVVWVPQSGLPGATTIFAIGGFCYTVNPAGTLVAQPAGSTSAIPGDPYDDCEECVGNPTPATGVKAGPCDGIGDEIYVVPPPATTTHFLYGGKCYSAAPGPQIAVPSGSTIVDGTNAFDSCTDCTGNINPPPPPPPVQPPGGPCPPFCPPPPPGGPGNPPPGDPPPNAPNRLRLKCCTTDELTTIYVPISSDKYGPFGIIGKVIQIDGSCYTATNLRDTGDSTEIDSDIYLSCVSCMNYWKYLPVRLCSDDTLTGEFVSLADYIAGGGGGLPVFKNPGGDCCYVILAEACTIAVEGGSCPNPTPDTPCDDGTLIDIGTRYATCAACLPHTCCTGSDWLYAFSSAVTASGSLTQVKKFLSSIAIGCEGTENPANRFTTVVDSLVVTSITCRSGQTPSDIWIDGTCNYSVTHGASTTRAYGPGYFRIYGNQFAAFPPPGATMTIGLFGSPPDTSGTSDLLANAGGFEWISAPCNACGWQPSTTCHVGPTAHDMQTIITGSGITLSNNLCCKADPSDAAATSAEADCDGECLDAP